MAEPARTYDDPEPASRLAGRSRLEVVDTDPVVSATGADRGPADEAGIGRSAMIGATIGFLVAAIGITVAGLLSDLELGSSLGLGVFVGMWGGAGFGLMMGATIPVARRLDAVAAHDRNAHGREAV